MEALNLYLGYDRREDAAYRVAEHSCLATSSGQVRIHPLDIDDLYKRHLLWRPVEHSDGKMFDHLSGAYQSTEFAASRFLVQELQRTGWAVFADCDVVFLRDIYEIMEHADPQYAVCVVKHEHVPVEATKMDGQPQTTYPRKNWSSVMLWNCDHPAHRRLSLAMLNYYPGELLHRFFWLRDSEIGSLPPDWNWLVNVERRPERLAIAHFTLGHPALPNWEPARNDEIWWEAQARMKADEPA